MMENLFKLPCFKLKLNNLPILMQWQSIHLNTHCHWMEIELVCIIFKLRKQVSRINLNGILIEHFKELIKEVYKFPIFLPLSISLNTFPFFYKYILFISFFSGSRKKRKMKRKILYLAREQRENFFKLVVQKCFPCLPHNLSF